MGNDLFRPAQGSGPTMLDLHTPQVHNEVGTGDVDLEALSSRTFYGHSSAVYDCAFSSTGLFLASASQDRTAKIWTQGGTELLSLKGHHRFVRSCHFSPDDRLLVTTSDDKTCKLWDLTTGHNLYTCKDHDDKVYDCKFSHNGAWFASASCDKTVRIWDRRTYQWTSKGVRHSGAIFGVAVHPNNVFLATASADKTIQLWDTRKLKHSFQTLSGHTATVWSCDFSPDGSQMVSTSTDGTIRLWNAESGAETRVRPVHTAPMHRASFAHHGRCIVSAWRDHTIKVWDAHLKTLCTLSGHTITIYHAVAHEDKVASASADGTLRLWNVPFERLLAEPRRRLRDATTEAPELAYRLESLVGAAGSEMMSGLPSTNGLTQAELMDGVVEELRRQYLPETGLEEEHLDPKAVAEIALDAGECVVCYDRTPDTTLLPCRHLCLCGGCARAWKAEVGKTNKCPICRQAVARIVHNTRVVRETESPEA